MKKSTQIIIAVVAIVVIVVIALVTYRHNQSNVDREFYDQTYTSTNINKSYNAIEAEKKIECTGEVAENGNLVGIIKNNNDFAVNDLEVEAIFFDENDNVLGTVTEELYFVSKNGEVAVEFYDIPRNFVKYEFSINVGEEDEGIISYVDKLEMSANDTGEKIVVQIKNNSSEDISYVSVAIVFYKEGKIVGFGYDTNDNIKSDKTTYYNINYPYNKSYEEVKFDTYKVFINEAYNYSW